MIKIPSEKQKQLLLLALGAAAVLAVIWLGLIGTQKSAIKAKGTKIANVQEELKIAKLSLQLVDELKADLEKSEIRLKSFEQTMAQGDLFRWVINYLQPFEQSSRVEFSHFEPPKMAELETFTKMPYKAASFAVSGTAFYHDFGQFLATFENRTPFSKIIRLELEPAFPGKPNSAEDEKLNFRIEFVSLVNSAAQSPEVNRP